MDDDLVAKLPSNRNDIHYSLKTMTTIDNFSSSMASQIVKDGTDMPKNGDLEKLQRLLGVVSS